MSNESSAISTNPLLAGLNAKAGQITGNQGTTSTDKKDKVGQNEFLTMLIAQLKNQDPLDPMKGDQFAVNLAQFSQLERLISIDDKIGASGSTDAASLAGYLGQEIEVNSNKVDVKEGNAGRVNFDLVSPSNRVQIQLVGEDGSIKQALDIGQMDSGTHSVDLNDVGLPNGEYQVKVIAQGASGSPIEVQAYTAGVVTGFVPGADPMLLIGDQQVKPSDVRKVTTPKEPAPAPEGE